jgi:hypothetical protein
MHEQPDAFRLLQIPELVLAEVVEAGTSWQFPPDQLPYGLGQEHLSTVTG